MMRPILPPKKPSKIAPASRIIKPPLTTAKAALRVDAVIYLSNCLSQKSVHKNAIFSKTKQFRAMVSIDDQ